MRKLLALGVLALLAGCGFAPAMGCGLAAPEALQAALASPSPSPSAR